MNSTSSANSHLGARRILRTERQRVCERVVRCVCRPSIRHYIRALFLATAIAMLAPTADAQIVRLPTPQVIQTAAVEPPISASSTSQPPLATMDAFRAYDTAEVYELDTSQPEGPVVVYPPERLSRQGKPLPPGAKPGIVQRLTFTESWVAPGGARGLGANTIDLSAVLAAPLVPSQPPFLITPRFSAHFLDGPTVTDLPPRVYDTALEFRWLRPLNDKWMADLAVAPGYYSDFNNNSSQAVRITGRALGIYKWSPTVTVALGAVYLDREDVRLLPAAGLIWKPNDTVNIELIFPRPKAAKRIALGIDSAWWSYVAGEFGGGSWAIERESGVDDVATDRDFRAILGVERKKIDGGGLRFEVAYVFGRKIEYLSGMPPDVSLDDTVMLRAGANY